ncbi:SCO7613 C-terminal domain-containing membrane protein [Catellatospora sichuanensis]|uniref:SCO7613 C-terminal domain-containing membrane protein n=1 Tax=Catellatospora sichuanensis TaxID=1969805 RepID=UPI0011827190|nr:permease [Catellatospora sichuanensis]
MAAATSTCSMCGRERDPSVRCPHCGNTPEQLAAEVNRLNKAIADMNAEDLRLSGERKKLSSKLQAALYQRDILAHAEAQRQKKAAPKQRRWLPRPPGAQAPGTQSSPRPPGAQDPGTPTSGTAAGDPGVPRQAPTVPRDRTTRPDGTVRRDGGPRVAPLPEPPPEASARSVQNIMLALGSLLLGIAAVVFAAVALSNVAPGIRLTVLALATALLLGIAPSLVRGGLSATAEALAAVGLALLPVDGYLLAQLSLIDTSLAVVAGLVFAATAAIAYLYHRATGLTIPRYGVVIAIQPVLPLLVYDLINGPAGWAVVLTVVAAQNAVLARAVELANAPARSGPPPRLATPASAGAGAQTTTSGAPTAAADPDASGDGAPTVARPATARTAGLPEGIATFMRRPETAATATRRSAFWLRELAWVLHGLAIAAATVYAVAALLTADTVPSVLRASATLLLAVGVALVGALMLRRAPLNELAAGAMVLAVIGSAARVAVVALPDRALLVIAAAVAITGLGVRAIPEATRRGPQLASTLALIVISLFTAGSALRAALAPVAAAWPFGSADVTGFAAEIAQRAGHPGWPLVATIALLTIAAALALPVAWRHETVVAGAALTALAAPASLGLDWVATQWLLAAAAIAMLAAGIGVAGIGSAEGAPWAAGTPRAARAHLVASFLVGATAVGVALAHTWSTAGLMVAYTLAGVLLAAAQRVLPAPPATGLLGDAAAGAAAFAAPVAVGTGVLTVFPAAGEQVALAASFLACAATLALVAARLVAHRRIGTPLSLGAGLGALAVAGAAFGTAGAGVLDAGLGALLLVSAILLALAPSIDSGRRADRALDGADFAAAAVTTALIAALARVAHLVAPSYWLVLSALLVLAVGVAVRLLPQELRRGPVAGSAMAGGILVLIAGYPALAGGIKALALPGELWAANLAPVGGGVEFGWQAPAALVVLAVAAAVVLPPPRSHQAAAVAAILATVGAPAALGWPWWAPIVLGLTIATGYALAAAVAEDARAGYTRLAVATAVALHALGASLVRPWTTAAALGMIALVGAALVLMAVLMTQQAEQAGARPPAHLDVLGGAGVLAVLLAGPAALAAFAASAGKEPDVLLTAALGGTSIGLAALAAARRPAAPYLGWGTVGVAVSGTLIALLALANGHPAGVYAAAAVLLVVLAELLRTTTRDQLGLTPERVAVPIPRRVPKEGPQRWRVGFDSRQELIERSRRFPSYPGAMAAAAAAAPAFIALASLAPALHTALVRPYDSLNAIWQGPPAATTVAADVAAVLTAVLLTVAAGIAAVGFGGGPTRAVSVVVPGAAVTLLIAPAGLGLAWPASVLAGLGVFTVCMLSVALTEPPSGEDVDRPVRAARVAVLLLGLIAGGAGLAGALATPGLTIFTFGGAVAVGAVAALGGKSQRARILGWLGAALAAQLFVLTVSLRIGAKPEWAAFGVLGVGAILIVGAALHPRFTRPEALREASAVEWAGYTAGVIALALAVRAPSQVAALLVGWGAVLGIAATRAGRPTGQRRVLFWAAAGSEIAAWWLIMRSADIALPEAYTLPFALLALAVGLLELRQRPQLGSWAAYGPALIAGFGPTVVVVLVTDTNPIREVGLLVAAILTLVIGSRYGQQAPVAIGATVTVIAALHALTLVGTTWLGVLVGGIVLIVLGANSERRRRAADRYKQFR